MFWTYRFHICPVNTIETQRHMSLRGRGDIDMGDTWSVHFKCKLVWKQDQLRWFYAAISYIPRNCNYMNSYRLISILSRGEINISRAWFPIKVCKPFEKITCTKIFQQFSRWKFYNFKRLEPGHPGLVSELWRCRDRFCHHTMTDAPSAVCHKPICTTIFFLEIKTPQIFSRLTCNI